MAAGVEALAGNLNLIDQVISDALRGLHERQVTINSSDELQLTVLDDGKDQTNNVPGLEIALFDSRASE